MIACIYKLYYMIVDKDCDFELEKEKEKKFLVRMAQIALWKGDFWSKLFFKVLRRHSYQEEFFLIGENPTKDFIYINLHKFLKKLKSKYKISCHRETLKKKRRLYLGLTKTSACSREIRHYLNYEICIVINANSIYLNLLPYSGYEIAFSSLDFQLVQNILEDFCNEFFAHPDEWYLEYLDFCQRLQKSEEKLTFKTSEIARSSIESIYNASAEKQKILSLGCIYSNMLIDGQEVCILYQDFLDDPQVLIKKLQKK